MISDENAIWKRAILDFELGKEKEGEGEKLIWIKRRKSKVDRRTGNILARVHILDFDGTLRIPAESKAI
jgi:hypothetical protein